MTTSSDRLRKMAARRLASSLLGDHSDVGRTPKGAQDGGERDPSVCVVHGEQMARKVVTRALGTRLKASVHCYGCCEDALRYTKQYDTFIVYDNFGKRLNGAQGVRQIRTLRPHAFIIGVTSAPASRQEFLAAGADEAIPLSRNEVEGLAKRIERNSTASERSSGEGDL